jgi:glutathione reductase (NADPH)
LVYRGKQILKTFDSEIVKFLIKSQHLKTKLKYHLETKIEVNKLKNDLIINLSNKKKISSDYILSATGRIANTENLGLENTNVQINDNNSIKVNSHFQTNEKNIYAVGDVIDYVNLTPVAIRQGHFLADKLFNNKKMIEYDFTNIPTAVFTSPQIGTVGLTLEMAKKNKIDAYELTTSFKSMKKTFSKKDKDTFYKLVISKKDKTILGIHIISDDAAELIQILAVNVVARNTLDDFKKTVAVHPTSSEEIITI